MKILYVEDELKKNISGIIQLFEKYLGEEVIAELENLMIDSYSGDKEIKDVIERCDFIEVAYTFPQAVKKVKKHPQLYSLFIVDCNLSEQPYLLKDLKEVAPEYNTDKEDRYKGREGEYLLTLLSANKEINNLQGRFYFLSAYQKSDNILSLIDNGTISISNYIEKTNPEEKENLINIINQIKLLTNKLTNKEYYAILEKIDENVAINFMNLIENKNAKNKVLGSLKVIRETSHKIYYIISTKRGVPKRVYRENGQIKIKPFIDWITERDKFKFNSNLILKNEMLAIHRICDDILNRNITGYQPTTDCVNYLIYALKDIILWYYLNF